MFTALPFNEIWAVDFEFNGRSGDRPYPVCMTARELRSGQRLRLWADELGPKPPFSIGENSLIVAYYASAELGWAGQCRPMSSTCLPNFECAPIRLGGRASAPHC